MADQKDEEADCLIVLDSQEASAYQHSPCLTAHEVAAASSTDAYRYRPRQVPDEPGSVGAPEQQVAGEGMAEEMAAAGQEQLPGPPGGDPPGHGGGGDGNQGGAGDGGGDGGEGGDPPEEEEEEEEEEAEEEAEEQVVTTSSSSGPSLPPLVPADPDSVFRLGLIPYFSDEERVSEGSMVVHSETSPEPEPQAEHEVTSSESGGGYSDAATAPLRGSDTESSRGQGHVSTPSTSGLRSPGASGHDVSSALSSLSSLSSSGETQHQPPQQGPSTSGLPHKRPMTTRRGGPHSIKRPKLDVSSSTDTSGRDTTSSTTTTTTTTSDTSHDDGPGGSGAPGDRSRSASGGERPHDRSGDKEDRKRKRPRDADQPGTSGLGSKAAGEPVRDAKGSMSEASRDMSAEQDEEVMAVGTLSLSQDDPYSMSCVPPSQGEFCLPLLFPGSPTDTSTTASRGEFQENPVFASGSSRPPAKEFQQWQSMNILSSPDYSSLDCEGQKELSQIPSSIPEEQNAASGSQRIERSTEAGVQVSLDSSEESVQFMGFENSTAGVRSQTSGGFESQNLHLQLTQSQDDGSPLKSGIHSSMPPALETLPGASQASTCSMTAEVDFFHENPSMKDMERSSQVKDKGSERSVASRKTDQSSPEVGRMDFPSFRLDRPVLDSMVDLENISPEKLKTPQIPRSLVSDKSAVRKKVDAKKQTVKKVLKFNKKGVEEKKKKRKYLSSKKQMLSTGPRAKWDVKKGALKPHTKRGKGPQSPDTICESLVEDSQTLEYHFTSVRKPRGTRSDVSTGKLDNPASKAMPAITESPTVGAEHSVSTAIAEVKSLEITPVTANERRSSRQSFLPLSLSPVGDKSVFAAAAAAKTNQKRAASDSLAMKTGPKLIRRSSNQSSSVMAGEVLHVTTRIRSLIERSQTFVLEFRGGRFVKNTIVREEEKLLSREMETDQEILSPVSTSRSTHSLSSGDMADVSSLEHKSSTTLTPSNSEISSHTSRAEPGLVGNDSRTRSLEAGNQSKTEMADATTGGRSSAGSLRISDILFSDLELGRGSLEKDTRRSSSSLFSSVDLPSYTREELAKDSRISDGSRTSGASCRSDLQPPARVSSDDSLFRQPLPPVFRRRSSGSSASASGLPRKDSMPISGSSSRESDGKAKGNNDSPVSTGVPSSQVTGGEKGVAGETIMLSNIPEISGAGSGSTLSSTGSVIPDTCLSSDAGLSRSDAAAVGASESCSAVAAASEADLGTASSVAAKMTDAGSTSVGKTPCQGSSGKYRVPPTPGLDPGTPVLAKWKDNHFYPGEVVSCEKRAKCSVLFDDGNQLTVKTDHVIPVSLVPVGQSVLADCGSGWNELVTVVSHWAEDTERGYVVRKASERSPYDIKIRRSQISLNKEQAASVMTKNQSEAPYSPTKPENAGNLQNSGGTAADQIDTMLPSGKLEAKATLSMHAERPEEYRPCIPPRLILGNMAESLEPGLPVFARWSDRYYYPANVVRPVTSTEACVVVAFDEDGSEYRASLMDVFVCDLLPGDMEVMAQREGVDYSEVAKVIRHFQEGDTVGYVVEFENGSQSRLTRKGVTLNHLQAGLILSSLRNQISETGTLGDVSLDNFQEGKRRRILGSAYKRSPWVTPNKTPPDSSRLQKSRSQRKKSKEQSGKKEDCSVKKEEAAEGKNAAPDLSCVASSEAKLGRKRPGKHFLAEMNQMNPRATSTPTPKRIRETGDLSPPFKTMLDSPHPGKKRTPKKSKTVLFPEFKGPLLPEGSTVFHEMTFILTHVEKTAEQREQEKRTIPLSPGGDPSGSHSVESFANERNVQFDKFYLGEQIESGGGEVMDEFDLEMVGSGDKCFLISDTHQRTRKYFCALAVGIPCVSHLWIRDSCARCALEDYRDYLLPSGMSLETQQLVKWQKDQRPLAGLKVVVSTENRNFYDVWMEILEAAGCQLIPKIPARTTAEQVVDVVVSDVHISTATWQLAQRREIPVVSSEWVVQCLVTGSRLGYTGHPKYRHDHE